MYTDPTAYGDQAANAAIAAFGLFWSVVWLAVLVAILVAMWKVFEKAGEQGWQALIPFWNTIVLMKIAGRPAWWFLLLFIPVVNIVIMLIVYYDLARSFGKDIGFTIGMVLLPFIFWPILGFGASRYMGPGGVAGGYPPAQPYPPPA